MSALIQYTKVYRLYIWIGSVRYYANRSGPFPRMSWHPRSLCYPDHFDSLEAKRIKDFYIDQAVRSEEVVLQVDET